MDATSGILSREVNPSDAKRDGHPPKKWQTSHIASLYVVDIGKVIDSDDRIVRYGRYIDTMIDTRGVGRIVAMAYVDSDRLRAAERALEEWMRAGDYVTKHPMACIPKSVMKRIPDLMSVLTSSHSGCRDETITQMEQKDQLHANEIRHLKRRLELRDAEIRLKDYELSLKDREISMVEHEVLLLRGEVEAAQEVQHTTM